MVFEAAGLVSSGISHLIFGLRSLGVEDAMIDVGVDGRW